MHKNLSPKIYLFFMFCFLYFPIVYLIVYSFNSGDTMVSFDGLSLQWYKSLIINGDILVVVLNTVIVALASSLIATIIGTLGAIAIYNEKNKRIEESLYSLNSVLLVSPDVIIGISLLLLFTLFNLQFGVFTVLLAHIAFEIPVVVILVLPKLNSLNKNTINAAYDLGATNLDVVTKVIIPYITPGIMAGFFTAFTYSLDDFAVTFFVTGNGFSTLAISIYSQARTGISLEINALSTIIFLITLVLAFGYYFIDLKSNKGGHEKVS